MHADEKEENKTLPQVQSEGLKRLGASLYEL